MTHHTDEVCEHHTDDGFVCGASASSVFRYDECGFQAYVRVCAVHAPFYSHDDMWTPLSADEWLVLEVLTS